MRADLVDETQADERNMTLKFHLIFIVHWTLKVVAYFLTFGFSCSVNGLIYLA